MTEAMKLKLITSALIPTAFILLLSACGGGTALFEDAEYVQLRSMLSTIKNNEAKAEALYKGKLVL
ncbi:MAG: hypothetical protein QF834_07085 [Candidatus Thalassarchaeaceae archaeon]|nr:hypothetical protein [Candidatus Thalassarchaeaceae archaeon]